MKNTELEFLEFCIRMANKILKDHEIRSRRGRFIHRHKGKMLRRRTYNNGTYIRYDNPFHVVHSIKAVREELAKWQASLSATKKGMVNASL